MRENLREQLSAMADDELQDDEVRFVVRHLCHDVEARRELGRHYRLRAMLEGEGPVDVGDLAGRVSAAIEHESVPGGQAGATTPAGWLRPVAGLAIAASVALATVVLWPMSGTPGSAPSTTVPLASSDNAGTGVQFASDGGAERRIADPEGPTSWGQVDPRMQQRLNGYLVNHSEYAATDGLGGFVNYGRIASQDDDR